MIKKTLTITVYKATTVIFYHFFVKENHITYAYIFSVVSYTHDLLQLPWLRQIVASLGVRFPCLYVPTGH